MRTPDARGQLPVALLALWGAVQAWGQTLPACSIPMWEACDLTFELELGEDVGRAELRAEFRSPRRDTIPIRAFLDDGKLVLRFTPTEAGQWDYRLTSSLARLEGKIGQVTATAAQGPGFVQVANVHHFQTLGDLQPHLWMGGAIEEFASVPREVFEEALDERVADGFTHVRVTIDSGDNLREAADRIRTINARGLIADIRLGAIPEDRRERERYITDMVARFAPFNMTWAGAPAFEQRRGAKAILRDTGELIAKLDGYKHIRTTGADTTTSPLLDDGWMSVLTYGTPDPNVGAVEHEFYQVPAINAGVRTRADLWNATVNGQYPESGSGPEWKIWFDFMKAARYWELEPYYDLDGGRALALPDVEYIVYVEKPGPVEMTVEDRGYKVDWMNPATGEVIKAKDYKGKRFVGEPPAGNHDWVLHVYSDGRLESLLKSYKFESRRVPVQEIETKAENTPFEIASPSGDIAPKLPPPYELNITRNTRATRDLLVLWMAENVASGEGSRVVGTGREGMMKFQEALTGRVPGVLTLRVMVLNAYGKAYAIDRAFGLTQ